MEESRKLDRTWLCSIVFSDIVNYSSQSVELQMKWKRYFNEVLAEALRSVPPDDRILLDTGDGAAICFVGEPEVALFTTLSIGSAFVDQAAKDDASPRIRLGINLGPVKIVRDLNGNLNALGDGINVAQRVMSFAAPNQVLVSQSFFEVVSRLSDDYKLLFRYNSVRKDKHIREHVVYELSPSRTGTSSAATQTAVEESSATFEGRHHAAGPDNPAIARKRALLLVGALAAPILVALVALIVLRSKPQANPQNPQTVSQVQQSPSSTTTSVKRSDGTDTVRSTEVPRTMATRPLEDTPIAVPRRESTVATPRPAIERSTVANQPAVAEPAVEVNGRWQAEVKYGWGASHNEVMDLKVDQGEVFGTASYLRTPRAIMDGKLEGTKLTFTTRSQTTVGDKIYEEKHFYRGRVWGDTIDFVLQTDSGYDSRSPETFKARRIPAATTGR
jgi:class 3 adenylate cyclase